MFVRGVAVCPGWSPVADLVWSEKSWDAWLQKLDIYAERK